MKNVDNFFWKRRAICIKPSYLCGTKIKYYETFFSNTFGLSVFYYACGPPSARESTVPNDTVPISISNLYGDRRNKMSRHRLPPFAQPSPLLCHRLLVHVDGACE